MTYEDLLIDANAHNLIVKEKDVPGYGGRIYKNRIAIHKGIPTQIEKSCILAEELGHYHTTYGDILDQDDIMNRKQEYRARLYGYNLKIGLHGLITAFNHGCRSLTETAEYLDVTEEYLFEAIECYRRKYGLYTILGEYIIYFEPNLRILRSID